MLINVPRKSGVHVFFVMDCFGAVSVFNSGPGAEEPLAPFSRGSSAAQLQDRTRPRTGLCPFVGELCPPSSLGLLVPCVPVFHVLSSNMLQMLGDATVLHCAYDFVPDLQKFQLKVPVLPPNFQHLDDDTIASKPFRFVAPMYALHCLLRYVVGVASTIVWVDPKTLQLLSVVCSHEYTSELDLRVESLVLELPGIRELLLNCLVDAQNVLGSVNFFQLATQVSYDVGAAIRRLKDAIILVSHTTPRLKPMEEGEVQELKTTDTCTDKGPAEAVYLKAEEESVLDDCISACDTARALSFLASLPAGVGRSTGMLKYLAWAAFKFVGKANVSLCLTVFNARITRNLMLIPGLVAALCMTNKSDELYEMSKKRGVAKPGRGRSKSRSRGRGCAPSKNSADPLTMVFECLNERKRRSAIFSYASELSPHARLIVFLALKPQLPPLCWNILDQCREVAFADTACLCVALCIVFYNLPCDVVTLPPILLTTPSK